MRVRISKKNLSKLMEEVVLEMKEDGSDCAEDEDEIEEATVTGDVEGYNSPNAFGDKGKGSKKKKRRNSENSTGFKMVKERIDNSVDKILESVKTDINEEITNKDLIKLKGIIRTEVAAILRDIWLRRSVWAQQR